MEWLAGFGILCVAVVIAVGVATRVAGAVRRVKVDPEKESAAEELREKERKRLIADAVRAGTHLADGTPRCRVCEARATHPGPSLKRDEAVIDLVRRYFGGPSRFRVHVPDAGAPRFCESHHHVAVVDARLFLVEAERVRVETSAATEALVGTYESTGIVQRVRARIARADSRPQDAPGTAPAALPPGDAPPP